MPRCISEAAERVQFCGNVIPTEACPELGRKMEESAGLLLRMQVKRATEAWLDSPLVTKLRQRRWRSATETTGNDNSRKTELFQARAR